MAVEHQLLHLPDGLRVPVQWHLSSKSRHIRVTVTAKGVRVSSPPRVKWPVVERFLLEQSSWLEAQLARHDHPHDRLLFQGQEYTLQLTDHLPGQPRVWIEQDTCFLAPVAPTTESAEKTLKRWLKVQAAELLTPPFLEMREQMGIEAPALKWKETSSRWGSCAAHGSIMLNWRLIHTPPEVAKYVIIHELAHRVHLNHSDRFWQLVERYDPAHTLHRGWLKRNGHRCRTPELTRLLSE